MKFERWYFMPVIRTYLARLPWILGIINRNVLLKNNVFFFWYFVYRFLTMMMLMTFLEKKKKICINGSQLGMFMVFNI